jgi:hypothetical protein
VTTATALPFKTHTIEQAAILLRALTEKPDRHTGRYHSVHLWGSPGLGKTAIVNQLGMSTSRPVIEFHAGLRDTVDLRGIPVSDLLTNTTRWLVPSELPNEERDGPEGYFFCDEVNQSSQQMQAVLGGLFHEGKIGDWRLPRRWRVIAAGNHISDRAAAVRMPTHLENRFAHIFVVRDVPAWAKWATANDVPPEAVAFARFRPALFDQVPRPEEHAFLTFRSFTKAAEFVDADEAIRQDLFGSHIGRDNASEFEGFLRLYRSLGSLDDIIRDPMNAKVPTEASERYAVCTGLARLATRKTWPNIMKYAERLSGEPRRLLIHDATVRDPKLKETAAYSKWAVEDQAMVLQSS